MRPEDTEMIANICLFERMEAAINYQVCQKSAPYFNAITNTKKLFIQVQIYRSYSCK